MVATQKYEEYVKAALQAGVDIIISGAGLPGLPAQRDFRQNWHLLYPA